VIYCCMVLYRLTTDIFPIMIYFIGFIWFFSVNNCLIIEFYTTLQIVILSKVARDLFTRYKLTAINCRVTNYPLSIDGTPLFDSINLHKSIAVNSSNLTYHGLEDFGGEDDLPQY
ncbi:THAP-type domain-containing protein, partial [Aphis craccivora]